MNCNLDELALLRFVKENPNATQIEIAKHIGKSERTVKRMTPALIERGLLERENRNNHIYITTTRENHSRVVIYYSPFEVVSITNQLQILSS